MDLNMLKIGITGGIGSGKTTISHILGRLGYPIYIADEEASRLMNNNDKIRTGLIQNFGTEVYSGSGLLNKKKLADLIFSDKTALAKVNQLVHPEVLHDFASWSRKQTADVVFFEAAILFEAGLDRYFDYTICIYAPVETRIGRVLKRDHTTREKVMERIANQMDDDIRCRKSDFIISTADGKMVIEQILTITRQLKIK